MDAVTATEEEGPTRVGRCVDEGDWWQLREEVVKLMKGVSELRGTGYERDMKFGRLGRFVLVRGTGTALEGRLRFHYFVLIKLKDDDDLDSVSLVVFPGADEHAQHRIIRTFLEVGMQLCEWEELCMLAI